MAVLCFKILSNMKKYLILLLSIAFSLGLSAQEQCGSDFLVKQILQDSTFRKNFIKEQETYKSFAQLPSNLKSSSNTYLIPVVFHIIYDESSEFNSLTKFSENKAENFINALNNADFSSNGNDMNFCLVKYNFVENSVTTDASNYGGDLSNLGGNYNSTDLLYFRNLSRWLPSDFLNVWVVNSLKYGNGIASAPILHNTVFDGVAIEYDKHENIFIHEVGHYLGLHHPFSKFDAIPGNTNFWLNNACDETDGFSQGDFVPDTYPTNKPIFNYLTCSGDGSNCGPFVSCPSGEVCPSLKGNFMSYYDSDILGTCPNYFTNRQKERMHYFLENSGRNSLINGNNSLQIIQNNDVCTIEYSNVEIKLLSPFGGNTLFNYSDMAPSPYNQVSGDLANVGNLIAVDENNNPLFLGIPQEQYRIGDPLRFYWWQSEDLTQSNGRLIQIDISVDGGNTFNNIHAEYVQGSGVKHCDWTVDAQSYLPNNYVIFRVRDLNNVDVSDYSGPVEIIGNNCESEIICNLPLSNAIVYIDNNILIEADASVCSNSITLLKPVNKQYYKTNSNSFYNLDLYQDNNFIQNIATSVIADTNGVITYNWNVPNDFSLVNDNTQIKISNLDEPTIQDFSEVFSIKGYDFCEGAVDIPLVSAPCGTVLGEDKLFYLDSSTISDTDPSCGLPISLGDVYGKITVPSSGELEIEALGAFGDLAMSVYSSCNINGTTELACIESNTPIVSLSGLTPGSEVFVRLWYTSYSSSSTAIITVCAYEPVDIGPNCSDGVQNQNETGIDCGGPCTTSCPETEIISPNGGVTLQAGILETIEFSLPSDISQFTLAYSPNNGYTWINPTDAGFNTIYTNDGSGQVDWNIPCFYFDSNNYPQSFSSSNSVIGIFDASLGFPNGLLDKSDAVFGFNQCNSDGFDLAVYNLFTSTSQAEQGDIVNVQFEVKNIGTIPINTDYNTTLRITTANNQACNYNGTLLDSQLGIDLWPGESDFISFSVVIPSSLQDGNYIFKVRADGNNQILETNTSESNNCAISNITVADPQSAFTDVIIQYSNVSPNIAVPNGALESSITVKNNGGLPANGVDVFAYLSDDGILDNSDQWLTHFDAGDILAGQTSTVTGQTPLPSNAYSGTKKIILVADGNNDVFESNEFNNEAIHNISYTSVPDLTPKDFYIGTVENYLGGLTDYEVKIANIGTANSANNAIKFYISNDNLFDNGDIYCGQKTIGSISTGNEIVETGSVAIPTNVGVGGKFLLAVVNENQAMSEFSYLNNVTAQPIEIEPFKLTVETTPASCGGSDGSASAIIDGGTGSFTYSWSPTSSSSSSINGLSPGIYTVTVTNSGYSQTATAYVTDNGESQFEWLNAETIESYQSFGWVGVPPPLDDIELITYEIVDYSAYFLFAFVGEIELNGTTYQSTGDTSSDLILAEIDENGNFNVIKHYETYFDNNDYKIIGLRVSRNSLGEFVFVIGLKTLTGYNATNFYLDGNVYQVGLYPVTPTTIIENNTIFVHADSDGSIIDIKPTFLFPNNYISIGGTAPSVYYNYLYNSRLMALDNKFYYLTTNGPLNTPYLISSEKKIFSFLLDGNFTNNGASVFPFTCYNNGYIDYTSTIVENRIMSDNAFFFYYAWNSNNVCNFQYNIVSGQKLVRYGANPFTRDFEYGISFYKIIANDNFLYAYIKGASAGIDLGSGYISTGNYQLIKLSKTDGSTIDVIDLSGSINLQSSNSSNQIFYSTYNNGTSYLNIMDDEGTLISSVPFIVENGAVPYFVKNNIDNSVSMVGQFKNNATFEPYTLSTEPSSSTVQNHLYHSILGIGGGGETFTIALNPVETQCLGESITLDVGVAEPGMTYSWSPGGNTSQTKTVSGTGIYTCTVTDANGCSATASTEVINSDLSLSQEFLIDESCNNANGEVAININGSYPPFDIQWSNGASGTNQISDLGSGNYTCTVTDVNGCTESLSFSITNVGGNGPVLNVTDEIAYCGQSNGELHAEVISGGVGPFNYTWNNGMTGADIYDLPSGTYVVTVTDVNGCTATETMEVGEYLGVTSIDFINIENVSCIGNDGEATLIHQGGTAPYAYQWSNGDTGATADSLQAGWHYVQVSDAEECTQLDSIYIDSPLNDVVFLDETISNSICGENGSIDLGISSTQALQFQWSNGATTEDIDNLPVGAYELEITFGQGCSITRQFTIEDEPGFSDIVLDYTSSSSYCNNNLGVAKIFASGGNGVFSYQWNTDANGLNNDQIKWGLSAGVYYCEVTSGNCQETIEVYVPGSEEMVLSTSSIPSYCGLNNGRASVEVIGGAPPFSFQWQELFNGPNIQTTQTAYNLSPGAYIVQVTDDNGCEKSLSVVVEAEETFPLNVLADDDYCNTGNGVIKIEPAGGYPPYIFSWNDGGTGSTRDDLIEGTYVVTVEDVYGCQSIESITISNSGELAIDYSSTNETCLGMDASITTTVAGGFSPYQTFWSTGEVNNNLSNIQAGVYSVLIIDSLGCSEYQTIEVISDNDLVADISIEEETCNSSNGEISINVSGGVGPITIAWSTGETGNSISNISSGLYQFLIEDANGCQLSEEVYISDVTTNDNDNDGICDEFDICIGGNDLVDYNTNGIPDDCETVEMSIQVMLKGSYDYNIGLMRTDLSLLGLIPLNQPYNQAPYGYNGTETLNTIPSNMVDWVLVVARSGLISATDVQTKAGLLLNTGAIVELDGVSPLSFDLPPGGSYHFVIRHRNHLDIMTANPVDRNLSLAYDFTASVNMAGGPNQQDTLSNGKVGMIPGDMNQDHTIQTTDFNVWVLNPASLDVYHNADINLDGSVQVSDYDIWYQHTAKIGNHYVAY